MSYLVFFTLFITTTYGCSVFIGGIGTVSPSGDVKELEGSTIRLQCLLNKTIMDGRPDGGERELIWSRNGTDLPSKYIHTIDEYSNELVIPNAKAGDSGSYKCLLHYKECVAKNPNECRKFVCLNQVMIGFPPLKVTDFSCVSPNWEYLMCSYTKPYNPVEPKYKLKVWRGSGVVSWPCKLNRDRKRKGYEFCNITDSKDGGPVYSQVEKKYYFNLTATNIFGEETWTFTIKHFERVLPNPPEKISVQDLTTRSLNLIWYAPGDLKKFEPQLFYKVFYQSQWEANYKVIETNENLTLTDLQPYTNYSFLIQAKSSVATDDTLWSDNATFSWTTLPDIPSLPPNVSSSGIQERANLDNRVVIVFWQMIPEYQKNGRLFNYKVSGSLGDKLISPKSVTENFAIFEDLLLEERYVVTLVSQNEMGSSVNQSQIVIPKKSEMLHLPVRFTSIYFGNGVYELSWEPAKDQLVETNFTLYWCDNIKPHPFMCEGNLSWVNVPSNVRAYNLSVNDRINYQFAVAANTLTSTSGLVWATCTIPYNGKINKMKTVKLSTSSPTSIKVTWKLDCTERIGIVLGYNVYYCPTDDNSTAAKCKGELKNAFKNGSHAEEYTIRNLKPYQFYKITVSAVTRAGEGEQSDGQFERTLQSQPVLNKEGLRIIGISNTSINISWDEPLQPNGVITKYIINCGYMSIEVRPKIRFYLIDNLRPYSNYTITLSACTEVGCSGLSQPIYAATNIGVPGIMQRPAISFGNTSSLIATFDDPVYPNGPISYYNLRVTMKTEDESKNSVEWFSNITTKDFLVATKCEEPEYKTAEYVFAVEAVNIVDNLTFVGPLSENVTYSCAPIVGVTTTMVLVIVFSAVSAMGVIVLLVCGVRKASKKLTEARNIKIYLPKGLETDDLKSSYGFEYPDHKTNGWIKASNNVNNRQRNTSGETRLSVTSMDELLQSSGDGRTDHQPGENSSGLSSVSSVQTTRSNLSSESSDSLPPTTPESVFPENPLTNSHKFLMPTNTLEVLPEASPPANYSHFGRSSLDGSNDGYLPTVGRRSQDSGYVLPSDPPPGSYSQLATAQNPPYMNYPNEQQIPSQYCQVAAAAPLPKCNNGYVATTDIPAPSADNNKKCTAVNEADDLPVEYSRLSFTDPKSSTGYVTLPDFTQLMSKPTTSKKPENPYVALDVVEDANESPEVMKSSMTSDDAMKSSITSEEALKSSLVSEEAMKSSMTSTDDAMKSSLTSDGYDSPGPYSRVVSMNFDESDTKES